MTAEEERPSLKGTLFVVATPLGNLADFSPRGCEVLSSVDLIACEDTRVTRKLLLKFGIDTSTTSFHEHNEEAKTPGLIAKLETGQDVALVSDAGTPLLSDPGYELVRSCREKGIAVVPLPGPFAGGAALSVSGIPTDQALFFGFLPSKKAARDKVLAELSGLEMTLVFYLSPHRIERTLKGVLGVLGDRRAFLIREMTKMYESSYYGTLSTILSDLGTDERRGEFTLVVEGSSERKAAHLHEIDVSSYVNGLMSTLDLTKKEAIKRAASDLNLPKREVYAQTITE